MILFERYIEKDGGGEDVMVRLEVDEDIGTQYAIPKKIQVIEGLSVGSPYVKIDFLDGDGDLSNVSKLDTSVVYTLSFGNEVHGMRVIRLYPIKTITAAGNLGRSENMPFTVHFIHESYREMIYKTRNRGWHDVKYSDIAADIAEECGLNLIGLTETKHTLPFVSQPYWSNIRLLKEIAKKSYPKDPTKSGHYEFGISPEGDFFFMCLSDIIDQIHEKSIEIPPANTRSGIPLMKLRPSPYSDAERAKHINENGFVPIAFHTYDINEAYFDSVIQGAGGTTDMYYDFEKGEYVKKQSKFSSSDIAMLSEWTNVHTSDELSVMRNFQGRDTMAGVEGLNRVSNLVNTTQLVKIPLSDAPMMATGDMLEVLIPLPEESYSVPVNEIHSGFYMVVEVNTEINVYRQTGSLTNITLARQGNDHKEVEGYVVSGKGKVSV